MRTNFLGTIFGLATIVIGLLGCGDGLGSSTGGTGGTMTSTSSTGGATSSGGTGGSTGGTTASGGTGGSTATGGTGGSGGSVAYGTCAKPCVAPADCCPPGVPECPSDSYPNNYTCTNGACGSPECMSKTDCTMINPAQDCRPLGGAQSCVFTCLVDGDCMAPLTCAGIDDSGGKYCAVAGSGCTDNDSCNGFGKCVEKVCVCETNDDCTFAGYNKCSK